MLGLGWTCGDTRAMPKCCSELCCRECTAVGCFRRLMRDAAGAVGAASDAAFGASDATPASQRRTPASRKKSSVLGSNVSEGLSNQWQRSNE